MILEFSEDQYVDIDKIQALRWIKVKEVEVGIVVLSGDKIAITEREEFDVIKNAYLWAHKSHMADADMNKIRFVKRGPEDE